jgi:hypothetical protein
LLNHEANGEEDHLIAKTANPFLELYILTKAQFDYYFLLEILNPKTYLTKNPREPHPLHT